MLTQTGTKRKIGLNTLVKTGILAAVATVLMYFNFPLPFTPPFMKIDISEMPALIGGFALGPLAGFLVVLMKLILKLIFQSTTTVGVGELSNLIVSSTFVVTASLIYHRKKTYRNAILSMVIGTLLMAAVATLSNYFFIFPMYMNVLGVSVEEMVAMSAGTNPMVSNYVTLMFLSVFPFNIIKGGITMLVTMLIYKPISPLLKGKY